ncbi:reverse transcriptase protein [Rutstroemia sp. NJR-2017a BBW]|nr:reverse transcriptase protein [Rutstroemia sp. NJR-2017a BBW]
MTSDHILPDLLDVWLDTKLNWKAHAKVLREKGAIALTALSRLNQTTWGPTLRRARVLYTACLRTALTYGAEAWHEPGKRGAVERELERVQAVYLRKITGAYRATPNREVEAEAAIPPISVYCDEKLRKFFERQKDTPARRVCQEQCLWIRKRSGSRKARQELPNIPTERALKPEKQVWKAQWAKGVAKWYSVAAKSPVLGKDRLKLHKGLSKAESAILIQSRTGRTSCAHFLNIRGVPGYESPVCTCCQAGAETIEHILLHCGAERARRQWRGGTTITELLDSPDRAQQVAKWLIQSGRFEHFRLANQLQYEY